MTMVTKEDAEAVRNSGTVKAPKLYQAISLNRAKKLGDELTKFLKDNELIVDIAGKKYVPVEGWQFTGMQLGLTEVVISCDPVPTEGEIKYKAVVEVINQNGTVISRGFAWCSNKESKKKSFEEYAIASMAQTRAIGKAYRNILSWVLKMSGYEATPLEEIDRDTMEADLGKAKQQIVKEMKAQGIDNSTEMMSVIQQAIGKDVVENTDEARKVMDLLKKDNE